MSRLFYFAAAVLLIPSFLSGQTGPKPVPAEWLHDGRLVVPEFNFSITSPSADARWFYTENLLAMAKDGLAAFIVKSGDTGYAVTVMKNDLGHSDPKEVDEGIRKSLPKDWELRSSHLEPSDVPVKY